MKRDDNLNSYLLGYLITKPRAAINSLLPDKYISVTLCMADVFPYFSLPNEGDLYIRQNGWSNLPNNVMCNIDKWIHNNLVFENYFQSGYFHSLEQTEVFIENFLRHEEDILILGIYLDEQDYDYFMTYDYFMIQTKSYFPISKKIKYDNQGKILGYEVFGTEYGWINGHDTKCNDLTKDIKDKFGYLPNNFGLYNSFDETREIVNWTDSEEYQGEQVPYISIMIVDYTDK
jgi:hypothetical protein